MKRQIRFGVFETNSSSVHTLTICSEDMFNDFKNGKLLFDTWDEELVLEEGQEDIDRFISYTGYDDFLEYTEYQSFEQHYTTKNGDKIVAFGYYGQS